MSKIDVIILHSDNTAQMKKCSTKGNKVKIDRKHKPEFSEGKSIFPLKTKFLKVFTRKKRVGFWVYGTKTLLEFEKGVTKIAGSSWTWEELIDYIGKLVHLSLVKEKPFSNLQVYLLFGGLCVLIVVNILILRRIGF